MHAPLLFLNCAARTACSILWSKMQEEASVASCAGLLKLFVPRLWLCLNVVVGCCKLHESHKPSVRSRVWTSATTKLATFRLLRTSHHGERTERDAGRAARRREMFQGESARTGFLPTSQRQFVTRRRSGDLKRDTASHSLSQSTCRATVASEEVVVEEEAGCSTRSSIEPKTPSLPCRLAYLATRPLRLSSSTAAPLRL